MRILYVYDGDWPHGATRVAKQTRSLAAAGHTVHLISRNDLRQPRLERTPWMTVRRLPAPRWRALRRAVNFPFFFNPVWIHAIRRAALDLGADCIVVRDLPLALTAIWVGRLLGIPVHYDMAEVYPEFLRDLWRFDGMRWSDHLVRNPAAADRVERRALRAADRVLVVSEESRERCLRLGVEPERLALVGNTPENVEALLAPHPLPPELEPFAGRPKVLFVGILIGDRGLLEALEAMRRVVREVPDALLVVVGDGTERPRIEAAIGEMGLGEHVLLVGWKQHHLLPAFYAHAQVGLLPFRDGRHVRITLANKLFDYMGAALPLVATDLPPMRRILEETGAGVLFPPHDCDALGDAIVSLLRDPARRRELGERGRRAVLEKYRWSEDERRLLAAVAGGAEGAPLAAAPLCTSPALTAGRP